MYSFMKHKIYSASLSLASGIRKLRLLHHGHSTNVLLFVHHLIEEQVLHGLLSKHRPLVLCFRGDNEIRTRDPLLARQVLSQLSYTPRVGLNGLEPSTSRLSGVRSNQLSYNPVCKIWQPPTFPYRLQHSIIGRLRLNHRVRDVYGCFP